MKRRVEFTTMKNQKMMRTDKSFLDKAVELVESRSFDFMLTDKKAKSNLKTAASRKPFEIERKQRCCNLKFSAGAFLHAVKPRLETWSQMYINGDVYVENELTIKVVELKISEEQNGNRLTPKSHFL